ncbi:UMP kinase [Candidatus Parcubacteria bacterium]|nr:UMP kinase [Patescibacteria group bacterium]MCG2697649.1 UMP kinase [Candidatus Parcubacteria bacterium]
MPKSKYYVISLGGSLIVPRNGIDWKFLKNFRELIIKQIKKNKKFIIITGGGNTARDYQTAASKVTKLTDDDKDWIGIHSTRLNAHLIKTIFRKYAHSRINKNPRTKADIRKHFQKNEKIMVAAGWRPGWSTDYVAAILAERLGAKTVINLSNIQYVYDKDPKKYKTAKKIKEITWPDFRKIVGNKWDPGLNAPFDPIASKHAEEQGLEVIIAEGKNTKNLEKYFNGEKFKGTVIKARG